MQLIDSYSEVIQQLLAANSSLKRSSSLERAEAIHLALNCPSSAYPVVHIAGSNGKGSVALKMAHTLEKNGYRVGLYTSPHLFDLRERIQINQEMISKEMLIEGFLTLKRAFPDWENTTFFERMTFLAFDYFKKKGVDIAVVETGLGGRLDATNICRPSLCVITSISREHVDWLGSDLELIAKEKAGIIKEDVPVVLGAKAYFESINHRAKALKAPLYFSKKISHFFDEENTATAELALEVLSRHLKMKLSSIKEGISIRPPFRFEKKGEILFDVAHNPDAIFHLIQALHTHYPDRRLRFLTGFSKDKEFDLCLDYMAQVAEKIYLVQADHKKAASIEELQRATPQGASFVCAAYNRIKEGVFIAKKEAELAKDLLIVCGSFYLMPEVISSLNEMG